MGKRSDEEKEILGFSKWNFSQKIPTVLADFSRLSVDYRAEHEREEILCFKQNCCFMNFQKRKVSSSDLY